MREEKILEQLHYFNIHSDIDSVYGNWAVTKSGDVVNYVYPYAIMSIHLYDEEWLSHMEDKVWFKSSCKKDLRKALCRAFQLSPNITSETK